MNAVKHALELVDENEIFYDYGTEKFPSGMIAIEQVKQIIENLEIELTNE